MSRHRLIADGPLWLLGGIAVAFVGVEAGFAARHSLAYDPFVACETLVTTAAARLTTFGVLLPLGVLGVVAIAAGLSFGHQMVVTRRTLQRVLARRRPLDSRLRRIAGSLGIQPRLDLVDDPTVFTFCHGLFRPRVCVSSGLVDRLSDDELLAVLTHEAHHVRHLDPLKILVGRTLASGLFFLPLAGALRRGYSAGKEICADADALAVGEGLPLARALYVMLGAPRPVWPAGVLAIGALTPTEARLRGLLEPECVRRTWPRPLDWIISIALSAGLFGFSYGAAAASGAAPLVEACAIETTAAYLGPATPVTAADAHIDAEPCPAEDLEAECAGR